MIFRDKYGLRLTASSQATVDGLDEFGDALLGFTEKVACIINVADQDPKCPLAQAYAAQFFASGGTRESFAVANSYLEKALTLHSIALPREQAIIEAAQHWCQFDQHCAARVMDQVLDQNSGDLISAKWTQGLHFDLGNAQGILGAPLKVAEQHANNAHLQGLLAFGYEECHLLDKAERAANKAIEIKRFEPWAHHAMAHVHEARHSLSDGLEFMLEMSDTWLGLNSFMFTHNWWHICLFLIDLNRADEALNYYDQHVWAHNRDLVQDEINAISLLYRLERVGVDVADRWSDIAEACLANSKSQISVFLDIHFLVALGQANRVQATEMLTRMLEKADAEGDMLQSAWHPLGRHLANGVDALLNGDCSTAARLIDRSRTGLSSIGGSHAQRDLIELFYIDALRGAGHWQALSDVLTERYQRRPDTNWLRDQLRETDLG